MKFEGLDIHPKHQIPNIDEIIQRAKQGPSKSLCYFIKDCTNIRCGSCIFRIVNRSSLLRFPESKEFLLWQL